ncbi:Protein of unknown function [Cotesia congregata]|uniref:Uncharacterized protein n=1 Tax=Cotesia congregata TaxID=51543 RepID=A0A8J2HJK8_COTCN|nr:Protein of unknown function [Cotesia congregata]
MGHAAEIQNLTHHQNITDAIITTMGETMLLHQVLLRVPTFDGRNMPSKSFLEDVESAKEDSPDGLHSTLLKNIKSKQSKKSYPQYCADIQSVRLNQDESVLSYYNRIKNLVNNAIFSLKEKFNNEQEVTSMKKLLDGLALESFKRGLTDDLVYVVSVQNPANIEDAYKLAMRIEEDLKGSSARNSNYLRYAQTQDQSNNSERPTRVVSFQEEERRGTIPHSLNRNDITYPRNNFNEENNKEFGNQNNSNNSNRYNRRRSPNRNYPSQYYPPQMGCSTVRRPDERTPLIASIFNNQVSNSRKCIYWSGTSGRGPVVVLKAPELKSGQAAHEALTVSGITNNKVNTVGSTELTFFKKPQKFHVFRETLPIPTDGIIGVDFLEKEKVEISFHHNTIVADSRPIFPIYFEPSKPNELVPANLPPIENIPSVENIPIWGDEPTTFIVKARTRACVNLKLKPSNLITGYLPRIRTEHEHIYMGENLVTNFDNTCNVFVINAYEEDMKIQIPPQEIFPFESDEFSEDFFNSDSNSESVFSRVDSGLRKRKPVPPPSSITAAVKSRHAKQDAKQNTNQNANQNTKQDAKQDTSVPKPLPPYLGIQNPFQMKSRVQRTPVKKKIDTIEPANKSIRPLKFTNLMDPPKPPDPPDDPLPEPRARNSAFPNLVQKRNAIVETDSEQENIPAKNRTNALRFVFDVKDNTSDSSANTIIDPSVPPSSNKKIVEVSAESSFQDPYWWDLNVQADQAATSKGQDNKNRKSSPVTFQHPLGNSTPLSHISDSETEDDRPPQQARAGSLPQIPEEFSSDSSLPSEQVENFENPNSLAHNITNELFYPNIHREKPKLLEIHSTNENLTYYRDNYLHFISADCEFTTQISRLLINTDYINPQDIKLKKPKVQQILVTPKGKHKVLSAVITGKQFDEISIPKLKNILFVLKDINHYELKTLRISKNGDMVMMGAIQLAILIGSLLQPISGFIAFDCSTPFLNITTLSLLDVKDCNIPPPKPVITHSNVQLLQTFDFSMIKIIQCKLKVRHIIRYCGEFSHLFGVINGDIEYIHELGVDECNRIHNSGVFYFHGTHLDLKPNSTTTRPVTFQGAYSVDGVCQRGTYTDAFGS